MLLLFFNGSVLQPTPCLLTLTANAPSVAITGTATLLPTPCALTLSAPAPVLDISTRLVATACELSLTAPAPILVAPLALLTPTAANLGLTCGPPSVAISGTVVVLPTPAILALSAPAAVVSRILDPNVLTLTAGPAVLAQVGVVRLLPEPCTLALSSGDAVTTIDIWKIAITIGGVDRADILRSSLQITDLLDEAPNTCVLVVASPDPPRVGDEIQIGVGSLVDPIFAGHLTTVEQTFEGKPANLRWHCTAVDYTRLLDRRLVRGHYVGQTASAIAADVITRFTSGFTTAFIAGDLPVIDDIVFTWEKPTQALTRLAKLIGGYWYVDYFRAIHFFLDEVSAPPDDIADPACAVRAVDHAVDITQIRTRVSVEGYGSTVIADVAAGDTLIPVDDVTVFEAGEPAPPPYSDRVRLDDPAAYWRLGDVPGQPVAHDEIGGHDGTISGGVTLGQPGPLGDDNHAATVDGATGRIAIPAPILLPEAFAVEAWIKTTASGVQPLVTGGRVFVGTNGGKLYVAIDGVAFVGVTAINDGRWHHVVYNVGVVPPAGGFTTATYIDGVLDGVAAQRHVPDETTPVDLGYYHDGGLDLHWPGGLDEVAIYAYTLSAAQVFDHYTHRDNPPALPLLVKTGAQRVLYSGTFEGGNLTTDTLQQSGAAQLWGVNGPATAVSVTMLTGGGVAGYVAGTYVAYAVSWVTKTGETLIGRPNYPITVDRVAAPASPPYPITAVNNAGEGKIVGTYQWRLTYQVRAAKTDATTGLPIYEVGETDGGAISPPTTIDGVLASAVASVAGGGAGHLIGTYAYKVTCVSKFGETPGGPTTSRTASPFGAPVNAPTPGQLFNTVGTLSAGAAYRWVVTYLTAIGETTPSPVSGSITIATISAPGAPSVGGNGAGGTLPIDTYRYAVAFVDGDGHLSNLGSVSSTITTASPNLQILISNIATGPSGVVRRAIFRARNADNVFRYIGDVPDNLTTSFLDDGGRSGAVFNGGTYIGGQAQITHTDAPAGALRKRFYRTRANGSSYALVAEVAIGTGTIIDNVPDESLQASAPTANSAGGEKHTITLNALGGGVIAQRLYRTAAGGSSFTLLKEFSASGAVFTDDTADAEMSGGAAIPTTNTAGGHDVQLTLYTPPTVNEGVVKIRVWRTTLAQPTVFQLVGECDPGTLTFLDTKADAELGDYCPTVNAAFGRRVQISNIMVGPPGTIARRVYRTQAEYKDGYRLLVELQDNVTTTYIDNKDHSDLGQQAPWEGTLAAFVGASFLSVSNNAADFPASGWAKIGSQMIRYTGIDHPNGLLLGIPPSGPGAVLTELKVGDNVIAAPMLLGIPASGDGALVDGITKGDAINVLAERDDVDAQRALAAVEGGDGVHEVLIQDNRLSLSTAIARARAELDQYATAEKTLTFTSRDPNLRSGKTIRVDLGPPTNIAGVFKIQQVVISGFEIPNTYPLRQVTASTTLYTLEHLLRRVELLGA